MISSTANKQVKQVVLLREKSRERNKRKEFLVEGWKMFEEAPVDRIREIYLEEKYCREGEMSRKISLPAAKKLEQCRKRGIPVETVTEEVFGKMSDTRTPQGILCIMEQLSYGSMELTKAIHRKWAEGKRPRFLLLEDIQDPGNLGTMIRTCEGAGADCVIMTGGCADIYNPKTIRSTMGSLYRVPFIITDDLKQYILQLRKEGIPVYAAHLDGENYYQEADYTSGCAFLIGNEGNGLSREIAALADTRLKIPMEGKLESLNAAIAAALLLYQSRL